MISVVMSSPQQRPIGDLVYSYLPEASFVMLKGKYKHDAQIIIIKKEIVNIHQALLSSEQMLVLTGWVRHSRVGRFT